MVILPTSTLTLVPFLLETTLILALVFGSGGRVVDVDTEVEVELVEVEEVDVVVLTVVEVEIEVELD